MMNPSPPDYERAAALAAETLSRFGIDSTPVSPFPILKRLPGVLVMTYQSISEKTSQDYQQVLSSFGENRDAFTTVHSENGKLKYIVTYNQRLSEVLIQRALARELGHILLAHDGTLPEETRNAEAICFAHHLLVPRPLIHLLEVTNVRLTVDVIGNLTGCYDHCLFCMRHLPGTHVPADLNRAVRDNFMDFFKNFFEYQRTVASSDRSAVADLGTYMDGYEE